MSPTGRPRLSARFAEWMMGLPAGWVTDVPGVGWGDQLKACGNGVVPQQAKAALEDMLTSLNDSPMPARVLEITRRKQ
jgi:DNA (cytosine-5)-methyltransferase 1